LHFSDEPDRDNRRKTDSEKPAATEAAPRARRRARQGQPGDVGNALKSVYQRTIDEDIPPEMLDLLGKLG